MASAARRTAVFALAGLVLAGCLDSPDPEFVRVSLDGDTQVPVRIITSSRFIAGSGEGGDFQVEIVSSDTTFQTPPFQQQYDIRNTQRFFVRVEDPEEAKPTVRMRVWVDDSERYNVTSEAFSRDLRFVYIFNQARGDEQVFLGVSPTH